MGFTLELIANGEQKVDYLPIAAHVHKYVEHFRYRTNITSDTIALYYFGADELDSVRNLHLVDRTYSIPANHIEFVGSELVWSEVKSGSFTSPFKEVCITNRLGTDLAGLPKPLFYRHQLPADTVEAHLEIVSDGAAVDAEHGYLTDLDAGFLFTNYKNHYDPVTGAYRLHFVVSADSAGNPTTALLDPEPAATEADWEDVDPDTGALKTGYPLYTREKNSSGYTFYMNSAETWYTRPLEACSVKALMPSGRTPEDSWCIRFTNGEFSAYVNNRLRRYWLPEADAQPFFPYKPYIYSHYDNVVWVNRNVFCFTCEKMAVAPSASMHLTLYLLDENGVLVRVLTTDDELEGTRYSDTDVFYEADKITSWDNQGGFVSVGVDLDPRYKFYASYYKEARDYTYSSFSLNPLQTPGVESLLWVFYMIPDVDEDDKAIHVLGVDRDGKIVYCSQSIGENYPNLQLTNADGSYNSGTVIGKMFRSTSSLDTFVKEYTVNESNDHAYYILAEVSLQNRVYQEDAEIVDVRERGAVIKEGEYSEAALRNPRIPQSCLGYGETGASIPTNGSVVLDVPVTVLKDYGGVLSEAEVRELLETNLPAATSAVINYVYRKAGVSCQSITTGEVNISITWEGEDLLYTLYRRESEGGEGEVITTFSNPPEGTILYTDTDVVSGNTYYYYVSITEQDIEYPASSMIAVRIK
jgi:hypothetical protein